jgi:hydroxymethylpyrimidine/phosphomethylpyrimidine kinase
MTATTALTAQNTHGVRDVHVTPPSFVEKQIKAVMEDGFLEGEIGVVKIGEFWLLVLRCRPRGTL